ncbi:AAA family ATPase [Spirosoma harenae]
MYIREINIKNIRSIEHFQMAFPIGKEAGWHVLIGDNGSGKSTIVRSIALGLLDYSDIVASNQDWNEWLKKEKPLGQIDLSLYSEEYKDTPNHKVQNRITFDRQGWEGVYPDARAAILEVVFRGRISFYRSQSSGSGTSTTTQYPTPTPTPAPPKEPIDYWFSSGYGPFRRFTGGDSAKEKAYSNNPHLGAHLSVFGEDVALSEALSYITNLYTRSLEYHTGKLPNRQTDAQFYDVIFNFINDANLLPHGTQLSNVTTDGVYFKDGYGKEVSAIQMSDGYRSILSMTFELIRQLVRVFKVDRVYEELEKYKKITLPGVVLIDEIDAHLHPTWQTQIGQWFTKYFPNLQFIVTTHSPLVCRAAEKGTIWRLAAPGSQQKSGEITGVERDRLIFGNVLDAYGTEAFGQDVERSDTSKNKLQRLAHLSQLNSYGAISEPEKNELQNLRKILITDDTTEF